MDTSQLAALSTSLIKGTGLSQTQVVSLLALPVTPAPGHRPSSTVRDRLAALLAKKPDASIDDLLSEIGRAIGLQPVKEVSANDISVDLIREIPINFAKRYEVLPMKDEGDRVLILTSNPLNMSVMNDLRVLFKKPTVPVLTTKVRLLDAINRVYEKNTAALQGLDGIEDEDYDLDEPIIDLLEAAEDDAPVIKLVNTLLFRAVKEKASDIHIEPYEKDMAVRYRIDGILFDVFKPPKKLQNSITSRIKVMGNLNIAEKRLPQDGRIPLKIGGKDIDVRLSTVPTAFGERLVMRLQDRSNVILSLDQLGFSRRTLDVLKNDLLQRTYGIVLVTGPTGSGKSTTLYASLQAMNSTDRNIVTVEDPVEQRIHGIGQIQVNSKIGLTFASGLRSILRQDPDTIMIGEIRDLETAEIAINSSLTGHLVLSTIHTNDSSGVFARLTDMGCEPFLIATSLLGVIAQRLVRVLCPHCKAPHVPTDSELALLGLARSQVQGAQIYRAVGCESCNGKGYRGRTIIHEMLMVTENVRTLIMQRQDGATIKKQAVAEGMIPFRDDGITKVLSGVTTIEEVLANTQTDI
jgi:general secretion pathway protein E